jgi:hypothetical protein
MALPPRDELLLDAELVMETIHLNAKIGAAIANSVSQESEAEGVSCNAGIELALRQHRYIDAECN